MPHLIVIYGAPLTGKTTLAVEVSRRLEGKTAVVSADALLEEGIRVHDTDAAAELEMVHTQARLLVANYLKNGYHVVLEGAFYYERDGALHRHEQEVDQTLALMRNLARDPVVVRLTASEEELHRRATESLREAEVTAALRIDAAYKARYGNRSLKLASDGTPADMLAEMVVERLLTG